MSDLQVRSTQASMPIPSGWLSSALPIAETCHHHDDKGRGAMCPSRRGLGGLQYLTGIVTFAYEQHHADTINVRRVGSCAASRVQSATHRPMRVASGR